MTLFFFQLAFEQSFKLPGSRTDIIRTKTLSGPSPVGGAAGGTEGKQVYGLDEFEYQAVHYNMACAHSKLGNTEAVSIPPPNFCSYDWNSFFQKIASYLLIFNGIDFTIFVICGLFSCESKMKYIYAITLISVAN